MASDLEHNNIIKYVFNGNKHLKHVLSDKDILDMTVIEGRFPLTKLPVCGHCEKLGLWTKDVLTDKPMGYCKSCGTYTRDAITYSTYLASKMDIDETGDSFRRMALVDRNLEDINRMVYLPDFTRLDKGGKG